MRVLISLMVCLISNSVYGSCQSLMAELNSFVQIAQLHPVAQPRSPILISLITQSQFNVAKAIQDNPSGTFFVEGLTHNIGPENFNIYFEKQDSPGTEVKGVFSKGLPLKFTYLTVAQKRVLFKYGGGVVSYLLGTVSALRQGSSPNEAIPNDFGITRQQLNFDLRESFQVELIRDFLKEHPYERVVLIWGNDHYFEKYFSNKIISRVQTLPLGARLLHRSLRSPILNRLLYRIEDVFVINDK